MLSLFDSVYRGYPVGTLLLAKKSLAAEPYRLGPFVGVPQAVDPGYLIIDGQQRVTTLVGVLLNPADEPAGDPYAIYFDLEEERFFTRTARRKVPETALPLRVVSSTRATNVWSRSWALAAERPELLERVDQLAQSIREFEIAASIVDGNDEPTLRRIFVRTNDTGRRLETSEVFDALHATSPETSLRAVAARLETTTGSRLEADFIMRCVRHVGGFDPGTSVSADLNVTELVPRTETALERSLAFLRADAEVFAPSTLPQAFPLLPLSGYFARFPDPSPRARRLLRRWFWRGMTFNEFADNGFGAERKWRRVISEASSDEAAASSMAQSLRGVTTCKLPDRWSNRSHDVWHLQMALCSAQQNQADASAEGFFLDDGSTGTWVALQRADVKLLGAHEIELLTGLAEDAQQRMAQSSNAALARAVEFGRLKRLDDAALGELGFVGTSRELLRAQSAELGAARLVELERLTSEFLRAMCETDLSDRPSIKELLTKGAA